MFINAASRVINNSVPIGAAMMLVTKKGMTKDRSPSRIAAGKSCNDAGAPVRLAIGTAATGPSTRLNTMTINIDAPNPTNPRKNPAANIVTTANTNAAGDTGPNRASKEAGMTV